MLFQKSMEPRCIYCAKGSYLEKDTVLCPKKGWSLPPSPAAISNTIP